MFGAGNLRELPDLSKPPVVPGKTDGCNCKWVKEGQNH